MTLLKKLDHSTGIATSDLAAKKDFIALKAEIDKVDINTLFNVPTRVNVDDLGVDKLKNCSCSDQLSNEVVKNTKFSTLKTKVNSLVKKIPDATTLIHINQYNTSKQNVRKNWRC